jgi:cyclohexanecarboxyl-CoA dehydrogenase
VDLALTPEQENYRREVRAFAERHLAPHYAADDRAARLRADCGVVFARTGVSGARGLGAFVVDLDESHVSLGRAYAP